MLHLKHRGGDKCERIESRGCPVRTILGFVSASAVATPFIVALTLE